MVLVTASLVTRLPLPVVDDRTAAASPLPVRVLVPLPTPLFTQAPAPDQPTDSAPASQQQSAPAANDASAANPAATPAQSAPPPAAPQANPELLLAFQFFDRADAGSVRAEDLETVFLCLGLNLPLRTVQALAVKFAEGGRVNYRKLLQIK